MYSAHKPPLHTNIIFDAIQPDPREVLTKDGKCENRSKFGNLTLFWEGGGWLELVVAVHCRAPLVFLPRWVLKYGRIGVTDGPNGLGCPYARLGCIFKPG